MPKVLLTYEQRMEDRNIRLRMKIADGLCATKNRGKMNMDELGAKAGVSRNTMSKILSGEDVTLTYSTFVRMLDLAGLVLKEGDR